MTMGSNPCVADREGAKMAIHYACLYGHWSCTQVMMEERWVVQNADGLKPLAQAVITDMHGQNRYIDARTCAGLTPLHMAAWAGHVEVAKILLAHGAFLNPKIVFSSPSTSSVLPGSTPTHLATRKNRIHVVKALLSSYVRPCAVLCSRCVTAANFVQISKFRRNRNVIYSSFRMNISVPQRTPNFDRNVPAAPPTGLAAAATSGYGPPVTVTLP
jgi:ankyrin repeat protein